MGLPKNNKVSNSTSVGTSKIYTEVMDNPSVDDVLTFMAHSEAHRRYVLPLTGISKDTQQPSDLLKSFLMDLGDG